MFQVYLKWIWLLKLTITYVKQNEYTCTYRNDETEQFLLVNVIVDEIFYNYTDDSSLSPELFLVSHKDVESAIDIFCKYKGDINRCISWIA